MMRPIKCILLIFSIVFFWAAQAAADDFIGGLRKVEGKAFIERDGEKIAAQNGIRIKQNDVIKTGKDASLGIVFRDNTRLSMGPDTELVLSRYVFEPAEDKFGFLTRVIKGTASYISGTIGKLAPEAVAIETPTATIGIRGTSFCTEVKNP